jgi:hypothetical protein
MAYFPDYDPATADWQRRLAMSFEAMRICGHCTLKATDACWRPSHPSDPESYRYNSTICNEYSPNSRTIAAGELACMTKLHRGIK